MSRSVALTALSAGISRLRTKGGADPSTLYDLLNGFVTLAGTVVSRPGTEQSAELPAGSKGLCTFNGQFVVFANTLLEDLPDGYRCEVIQHPTEPTLAIDLIWFAAPYLGFLYVAAQFTNGNIFHYWLRGGDAWQDEHAYAMGDLVEPTVRNGYVYEANRIGGPALQWAPDVARQVGDVVEPTTPNGFKYECIAVLGTNPRSGATEPTWPTEAGATVNEDTDVAQAATPTTAPSTPDTTSLPQDVIDRYGSGLGAGFMGVVRGSFTP